MARTFDQRAFRDALGCYATGVTVITTSTSDGQVVGITANSFTSISMDPPLVMWSPAKSSRRHNVYAEASHFAVHVLTDQQIDVAAGFVKEANAFGKLDWSRNAAGVPVIEGCFARFECQTHALHDAGDHTLILGHVDHFSTNPGAPLIFSQGKYLAGS